MLIVNAWESCDRVSATEKAPTPPESQGTRAILPELAGVGQLVCHVGIRRSETCR